MLDAWEEALQVFAHNRRERRRLRREERAHRKEAADWKRTIDRLQLERSALLVQGGAADRDEFERRAGLIARRRELEELRAMAQEDLDVAQRSEPNLAIVEEDLLAFDAEANAEQVRACEGELETLEREVARVHERRGGVAQELAAIENDRREPALRFERAQVRASLREACERRLGLETAAEAVTRLRETFERTCQPAVLQAASGYFARLTDDRFTRVWTPLGERTLRIDDAHGKTRPVAELSGGTREQLFLAIRLALIARLAERGVELPIVLDDVLVNFDQPRTEAAIDLLLHLAADGQQLLVFTCHRHLAEAFERRGIEPVPLPGHAEVIEERRAG